MYCPAKAFDPPMQSITYVGLYTTAPLGNLGDEGIRPVNTIVASDTLTLASYCIA